MLHSPTVRRPRVSPTMLARHSAAAVRSVDGRQAIRAFTDWSWFLAFVEKGGPASAERMAKWKSRRNKFSGNWTDWFEEFKSFRHEAIFSLRESDFENARRGPFEHSLEGLIADDIKHRFSRDFSPPIPVMYPFHVLLEKLGRLPTWGEAWTMLLHDRPDYMFDSYAQMNGFQDGKGLLLADGGHLDALQWRVGLFFYSWYREVHLITVLRRRFGLDVLTHFAVDAEWKADVVGGDVLLEVFISNEKFKEGGSGRKEACAEANPWARTVRVEFEKKKVYGRPWLLPDRSIAEIAARMSEEGCPRLHHA